MSVVRELTPEIDASHLCQLVPAFLTIWNAPENFRYLSFSLRPFEEAIVRGWLSSHVAAGVRYFAAFNATEDVLGISVTRSDPSGVFELFAIGVRPDVQCQGIGQRLISHVLRVAASAGFTCVEASVFADNVRMLRLALSLGFLPVRIEHHRRADGADLLVLQNRFPSGEDVGG